MTNPGTGEVDIEDFSSSCTCSSISPRSLVIPSGQTRTIRLTIDLTGHAPQYQDNSVHEFEVSLAPRIKTGSPRSSEVWAVRGRVRTVIQVKPSVVDLGRYSELAQPLPAGSVEVMVAEAVRSVATRSSTTQFHASLEPVGHTPGRRKLTVTPVGKLRVGPISSHVTLLSHGKEGRRLPPKEIRITGEVLPDVQASPPAVLFGAKMVGEKVEDTLTLRSLVGQPFRLERLRVDCEGFSAERTGGGAESGIAHTIRMKGLIRGTGEVEGRVWVTALRTDGRRQQIAIPLRYHGLEAGAGS